MQYIAESLMIYKMKQYIHVKDITLTSWSKLNIQMPEGWSLIAIGYEKLGRKSQPHIEMLVSFLKCMRPVLDRQILQPRYAHKSQEDIFRPSLLYFTSDFDILKKYALFTECWWIKPYLKLSDEQRTAGLMQLQEQWHYYSRKAQAAEWGKRLFLMFECELLKHLKAVKYETIDSHLW